MTKPVITSFQALAPLIIQQYERYLPTAFDDSLSMLQKVNKIIQYLNENGLLMGDLIKQWDEIVEWVMNEGLSESVVTKLDEMVANGTMATLINDEVFTLLSNRVTDLERKTEWIDVSKFGYTLTAVNQAIATLQSGDTLYFPKGTYQLTGAPVTISVGNIKIRGNGKLIMDYGFRLTESNVDVEGLEFENPTYSQNARAIMVDVPIVGKYVKDFKVRNCHFKNFFYACYFAGGAYEYNGTESVVGYPVRDVVIENCFSETYKDQGRGDLYENNAGHFQCLQVENVMYLNNRTYGGRNATSYNIIKANGSIKVIGNYDHENTYGSCEVENASGKAVVANNIFKKKIWIDDSFDVIVIGNVTNDIIHITVGSNNGDAKNVIVANNVVKSIRAERFGSYLGGTIRFLHIQGNTINGDNTHGLWVSGNAVEIVKVSDNIISGVNTNDISITRDVQLQAVIKDNIGNGKLLLVSGTGGKVFILDNYNITPSGTRESLSASHSEREFNGVRLLDDSGIAWRLNLTNLGVPYTVKY
jgi:hypothetical protein